MLISVVLFTLNISGHLGARLSFCKLLEVLSIVSVSEICIFHLEKLFMNLTGAC